MAKKKKNRIDTASDSEPMTNNPFGSLGGMREQLPEGPAPGQAETPADNAAAPWRVTKTRKGGWPLSIEKRPGNKVVTVVANVERGGEELLKALKKRCGAGGVHHGDSLEIQGDHREAIGAFLDESR